MLDQRMNLDEVQDLEPGMSPESILILLTNDISIMAELSYSPHEMPLLWPDTITGLKAARAWLAQKDLPLPGPAQHLLDQVAKLN